MGQLKDKLPICSNFKICSVWFVSNCDNTNGARARWEYGKQLIKAGLSLEGYGKCFNNELRDATGGVDRSEMIPWRDGGLISRHKFYLAFENSIHCNDYISEKLWRNSLQTGAVPIIFGPHRDDVLEMAPPNSYIHVINVEDFKSLSALVDYWNYLKKRNCVFGV